MLKLVKIVSRGQLFATYFGLIMRPTKGTVKELSLIVGNTKTGILDCVSNPLFIQLIVYLSRVRGVVSPGFFYSMATLCLNRSS